MVGLIEGDGTFYFSNSSLVFRITSFFEKESLPSWRHFLPNLRNNRINLMGLYILIPTTLTYKVERLYAKKLNLK